MKNILSNELSLISGGNQEEVMPVQNTNIEPAGMKSIFVFFMDNNPEESMKVLFSEIENQTCQDDEV